jgi:hypothetical protein
MLDPETEFWVLLASAVCGVFTAFWLLVRICSCERVARATAPRDCDCAGP